ncbi:MAG: sel1 repeat family protein, partial [Methylocystaceae bacterium]|nr:sel1 repeat family protein [Methylocystaceae bacterium]
GDLISRRFKLLAVLAGLLGGYVCAPALAVDQPSVAKRAGAKAPSAEDVAKTLTEAMDKAKAGDPAAQHTLSLFYWHGIAITQNFQEAINWNSLAAISGSPKAAQARPEMVKKLDPKAVNAAMVWARGILTKEAEGGNDRAVLAMANSYAPAFGFPNDIEAYFWFTVAATSGDTKARRLRDKYGVNLKTADLAKTQTRANDWFGKWRKPAASQ